MGGSSPSPDGGQSLGRRGRHTGDRECGSTWDLLPEPLACLQTRKGVVVRQGEFRGRLGGSRVQEKVRGGLRGP